MNTKSDAMKKEGASLSLKQIHALEATARLGGFSQAAAELGVSQPSVSNLVHAAETRFGCRLLTREHGQVAPTPLLRALLPRLRAITVLSAEIARELQDRVALRSGQFKVGYSTYRFAMPILAAFIRDHPGLAVTARAMASHDLLPLLRAGELDVAFITAQSAPEGLESLLVRRSRVVAAVPVDHPLAARDGLRWADLDGAPLIQREESSGTRRLFEAAAARAGITLRTVLALGSWGSMREMALGGVGVAIVMEGEAPDDPALRILPLDEAGLEIAHFLTCLPEMRMTAAVGQFFAVAADA